MIRILAIVLVLLSLTSAAYAGAAPEIFSQQTSTDNLSGLEQPMMPVSTSTTGTLSLNQPSEEGMEIDKSNTETTVHPAGQMEGRDHKRSLYADEKSLPRPVKRKPVEDFDYVTVVPEVAQAIELSNTDNNRFICNGEIQDVVYSAEKGVIVKFSGQNAFIKFKITKKSNGELVYAKNPTELFIVCNQETYNIIGLPKKIQAQTIRLSTGKKQAIKKNLSLMSGLALEKKVLALINYVHKDAIPDSFEILSANKKIRLYKGIGIVLKRSVQVTGEGLLLKEYYVSNTGEKSIVINEGHFLKPEITANTVALAIGDGKMNLDKGDTAKLYVVELADGGNSLVKN